MTSQRGCIPSWPPPKVAPCLIGSRATSTDATRIKQVLADQQRPAVLGQTFSGGSDRTRADVQQNGCPTPRPMDTQVFESWSSHRETREVEVTAVPFDCDNLLSLCQKVQYSKTFIVTRRVGLCVHVDMMLWY